MSRDIYPSCIVCQKGYHLDSDLMVENRSMLSPRFEQSIVAVDVSRCTREVGDRVLGLVLLRKREDISKRTGTIFLQISELRHLHISSRMPEGVSSRFGFDGRKPANADPTIRTPTVSPIVTSNAQHCFIRATLCDFPMQDPHKTLPCDLWLQGRRVRAPLRCRTRLEVDHNGQTRHSHNASELTNWVPQYLASTANSPMET